MSVWDLHVAYILSMNSATLGSTSIIEMLKIVTTEET